MIEAIIGLSIGVICAVVIGLCLHNLIEWGKKENIVKRKYDERL